LSRLDRLSGFKVDHLQRDSRQGMSDPPALPAHLPESRGAVIPAIHGHHRRALRRTITLERPDAETIFECQSHALRELFRSHQHILERAEAFGPRTPYVGLEEARRRDQERHFVLLNQPADPLRIERIRMEYYTRALDRRQPQPGRESEGMKKRQDPEELVPRAQPEHLGELADVRRHVEMGEHHPLGVAGGSA